MNLFTDTEILRSIHYSQGYLLQAILHLHCQKGIQLDATFGKGVFYKSIPRPQYCYDAEPKANGVSMCNAAQLPHGVGSIESIMFDPPFIVTDHTSRETNHEAIFNMTDRFSGYKTIVELRKDYRACINEFARVLKKGGILVVKCQDTTHGKVNYFIHNEVYEMAKEAGFRGLDLFILGAKTRFNSSGVIKQRTARKYHSYFWVFQKMKRPSKHVAAAK